MAFCSKCGTQMGEGMRFCGTCGQNFAAPAAAPGPVPGVPASVDPSKPIATLDNGFQERIDLFADRAELSTKTGAFVALSKNNRTYFYSDLSTVQFLPPATLKVGYLRFIPIGTVTGGVSGTSTFSLNTHITNDVDTLTLPGGKSRIDEYQRFYDFLMRKIRESKRPRGGTAVVNQQASAADELLKYKQLFDAGVLTQAEFDAKKRQLIG